MVPVMFLWPGRSDDRLSCSVRFRRVYPGLENPVVPAGCPDSLRWSLSPVLDRMVLRPGSLP